MKILLYFPLFFSLSGNLLAQIDYPTQPENGYYESLKKQVLAVLPSEANLIASKQEIIPPGFKDTLLKYDWYEIANYFFFDKEYGSYFSEDLDEREKVQASNQFNFIRYTNTGIIYEMALHRYKDASLKVKTYTFDENNAGKLLDVKKVGAKYMKITSHYGEKEQVEILSYKNGVMILNIKQSPSATTKRFHIAYCAVKKSF